MTPIPDTAVWAVCEALANQSIGQTGCAKCPIETACIDYRDAIETIQTVQRALAGCGEAEAPVSATLDRPLIDSVIASLLERGDATDLLAVACIKQLSAEIAGKPEAPADGDVIPWAEYPWAQYSCLDRHDQRMMTEFEIRLDGINWVWADKDGRAEFIDIPRPKPDIAGSLRKRPEGV